MSKYDINTLENPNDKTALEKKHVPHITCPDTVKKGEYFDVTVEMGKEIEHPMEEGHFIQYFEVYANYFQLARVDFTHEVKAEATLKIKLDESATLRVFENCNLHGQWEASKEITVE
ncbi:MAG: class II SORL domain-containing protein [Bacillota bacterium]